MILMLMMDLDRGNGIVGKVSMVKCGLLEMLLEL